MTPQETQTPQEPAAPTGADSTACGPLSAGELLREHCGQLAAEGGAILRLAGDGRVDIVAVWPEPAGDRAAPDWLTEALASAAGAAATAGATVRALHERDGLYGHKARRHLLLAPLGGAGGDRGVAAFAKQTTDPAGLAEEFRRLTVRAAAGEAYGLLVAAAGRRLAAPRLLPAMASLSVVNEHDRFLAAAMALCNDLASRWRCERVSLGFLHGRYVRLVAMSHTEKFSRKTDLAELLEAAMEECLDQDVEVALPAGESSEAVYRCARELSVRAGHLAVLSLPLRRRGTVEAVLTLERAAGEGFSAEDAESLRLTCELCTPRLLDLRRQDRWAGAKAAEALRAGLAAAVGPRHTWAKLAVLLAAAAAVWLGAARGDYRIEAPFVLEASRQQVLSAPFDGHIDTVAVQVGDDVRAGSVLARLRTLELERKSTAARAELFEYEKQADAARSEKKWAEAQMAAARAQQLAEQIQLLREQIEQASLRAHLDGTVVKGDLKRFVGSSVQKGQVLLEIAPLDSLRAELAVPQDQVADLLAAQRAGPVGGRLATASHPDRTIDFVVERVFPMAEQIDGATVFKVRARLGRTQDWMRPGMEGVAHVTLGRRALGWIWSRRLVNWLRLWLWW